MKKEVENFYDHLKSFYSDVLRTRSKTISTREFKQKVIDIYEAWKTDIHHVLEAFEIENDVLSRLDNLFNAVYEEAKMRVANINNVKTKIGEIHDIFWKQVVVVLRREKETASLMESASFLGLDFNWSLATCALQLQEVAITLVAKRKNILLDKANVERTLNKRIQRLTFNDQYEAFSVQVKKSFEVEMPILAQHLRKMRAKVLHEGYNPKPEETESIVGFTIGLLQKLEGIN